MFKGVYTAIVTPFNMDNTVNYSKLRDLLLYNVRKGVDGIVICGTTGESTTLKDEEIEKIVKETIKTIDGKLKIIVGTGSNNTEKTIKLSKVISNYEIDGLLIITPYYNQTNKEGIFKHFKSIANSVSKPIMLYNVPSRTNVDLCIDNINKLSKIDNIVAIKEASNDLNKAKYIINNIDINFLTGNDLQFIDVIESGGDGIVSVFTNIFPKVFVDIYKDISNKDEFNRYKQFIETLFIEPNPIPVKECLNLLGLEVGNYRLPLNKMSDNNKEKLMNKLWEVL